MPKSKTYEEFVEKFKPKKTTDDCYTPPEVYETVKKWAIEKYKLDENKIKIERPFYPGGDYEKYPYDEKSVVIDNPPFSILANIMDFYLERDIRFFLFAPQLTLFSKKDRPGLSYVVTHADVVYENGAIIKTSFVTNMDDKLIRVAGGLNLAIRKAQGKKIQKRAIKYNYPDNLITSSRLGKLAIRGVDFAIEKDSCYFVRRLDEQVKFKKTIYGAGFLVSDEKAKELKSLMELPTPCEKGNGINKADYTFTLSDSEKEIVKGLE